MCKKLKKDLINHSLFLNKIENDLIDECKSFGYVKSSIEIKHTEDLIFVLCHVDTGSNKTHRCFMYLYNSFGTELYNKTSTVIDIDKLYTMSQCFVWFRNRYNYISRLLHDLDIKNF